MYIHVSCQVANSFGCLGCCQGGSVSLGAWISHVQGSYEGLEWPGSGLGSDGAMAARFFLSWSIVRVVSIESCSKAVRGQIFWFRLVRDGLG